MLGAFYFLLTTFRIDVILLARQTIFELGVVTDDIEHDVSIPELSRI